MLYKSETFVAKSPHLSACKLPVMAVTILNERKPSAIRIKCDQLDQPTRMQLRILIRLQDLKKLPPGFVIRVNLVIVQ